MPTKLVAKKLPDAIPACNICGEQMNIMPEKTEKLGLKVYVCANKKEGERLPCDGHAYRIMVNNASNLS